MGKKISSVFALLLFISAGIPGQERTLRLELEEAFPGISPIYIQSVADTPRTPFLPENFKSLASTNLDLPAAGNSIIPSPFLAVRIIEAAAITPGSNVLIIGKGTGYIAAAAAWISENVTLVEFSPELFESYPAIFEDLGVPDIRVTRSVAEAAESGFMFDAVIVHGGVFSLKKEVSSFLRPSGTLILPITGNSGYQNLLKIRYGTGLYISSLGESFFPVVEELEE